jgi:hypothetical protein
LRARHRCAQEAEWLYGIPAGDALAHPERVLEKGERWRGVLVSGACPPVCSLLVEDGVFLLSSLFLAWVEGYAREVVWALLPSDSRSKGSGL